MKIVLISFHFSEYTYLLGRALAEKHDVLLVLNEINVKNELGNRLQGLKLNRLKIVLMPDRRLINPLMLYNIYMIVTVVKKFNPDVIHCQEAIKDYLMGALILLRKWPLVLTIHDHVPHTGRDSRDRKRINFYRKHLRNIPDVVIVHGERIRNESIELMPWLKKKIVSIPHGILGASHPVKAIEWQQGAVLFFGRIEKYKGLKYFIDAIKLVAAKQVNVKGIIAGTGEDLEYHRAEIQDKSIFELIDRYIKAEEIPALFGRANAVILPYTDATQSGVVAMAVSHGRPVISTQVGSIDEVIKDGYNGLLVPTNDVSALSEAIIKIIENQELALQMAKNARRLATTKLSWEVIADDTVNAYKLAMKIKYSDPK